MKNTIENLEFRPATKADLPKIVQMLAEDPLGARRERYAVPLPEEYTVAFDKITNDENNEVIVAYDGSEIMGFFQITYIPYLTYMGRCRALVEGVRVNKQYRAQGIGKALIQHSIELAKQKNCHLIQLTTDKTRPGAISFYKSMGFIDSHEGMKLHL